MKTRVFWLSVTIFTVLLISVVILMNMYSLTRNLEADCSDEKITSKIYEHQEVRKFLSGHPQHGFEPQGHREHFPSQCQYWFYDANGVTQSNLWIIIDKGRHYNPFTLGICFDHDSEEPRKIDPFKVPDLTSENCDYAY